MAVSVAVGSTMDLDDAVDSARLRHLALYLPVGTGKVLHQAELQAYAPRIVLYGVRLPQADREAPLVDEAVKGDGAVAAAAVPAGRLPGRPGRAGDGVDVGRVVAAALNRASA